MTRIHYVTMAGALAALLAACGPPANPPQSPINDTQPPVTTTGDGQVLGADRVAPGQKLEEGPTLDTKDGVKPAATSPTN